MIASAIDEVLRTAPETRHIFLGVFARNELPLHPAYPSCLVFNTEPRGLSGEHWLGLFYDEMGRCDFFDSYAMPASRYGLNAYLDKTATAWKGNKKRIQGDSLYCGHYVIFFLLFRARSEALTFFQSFGTNFSRNDKKLKALIEEF